MNEYIINQWRKIFDFISFKGDERIVDLLPGNNPKVEIALSSSEFKGLVYLVDYSEPNVLELLESLEPSKQSFKVDAWIVDILRQKVPHAGYIVGNHIIDDLLAYEFCREKGINPSQLRIDADLSRRVWNEICYSNSNDLHQLPIKAVSNAAESLTPDGTIILSSYRSKFERQHKFEHESSLCKRIFGELRRHMCHSSHYHDKSDLIQEVINPDNELQEQWLYLVKIK